MEANRRVVDSRLVPQLLKRRDARHVGRERQQRDREEDFQAHELEAFVATDEGGDQQAQRGHRTNGRDVVQQQVNVREIK